MSSTSFDNSFEVPLPPTEAWPLLMDIPRIAQCIPGARLTDVLDQNTFRGRISVPLGPVELDFAGLMKVEALDPASHTARVTAQGADAKRGGDAQATASFRLEPAGGGSKVLMHMELMLSGGIAQYGSSVGLVQTTANKIMNQFADNLRTQVAGR